MAKIKDIAKLSGVSSSTVSRILNKDSTLKVTMQTKKKVLDTAEHLGYVPIKHRKSKPVSESNVAIVSWYTSRQEMEDSYYMQIRLGSEKRLKKEGLAFTNILFDPENLPEQDYDAVIAIGKYNLEEIETIFAHCPSKNVICVDSSPDEDSCSSVCFDFSKAMEKVLSCFHERGHRHIGYIGGREYYKNSTEILDERFRYFKEWMQLRGIFRPEDCYFGEYSYHSGYNLMMEAIRKDSLPSAFFLGNDIMAFGAYKAVSDSHLRIPEDISIIGFNDLPNAKYMVPPLTTIRIDCQRLGQLAAELLLAKMKKQLTFPLKATIPISLSLRESVTGLKK